MFLFAHVGITLGAAALVSRAVTGWRRPPVTDSSSPAVKPASNPRKSLSELTGLKALSRFLDLRLLVLGSLLPDLVDKTLAFSGFGNGRSITHTLLIFLIVMAAGLYFYFRYKNTGILAVAIGLLSHVVLDSMWESPKILFWPYYGRAFPGIAFKAGFEQIRIWWNTLLHSPRVDISEGVGLVVLLIVGGIVAGQKGLKTLLLKGRI
jgi:inner membrane protein